ncbi:Hsp20/alpha crystallin family protein [Foetidibacter luteolus]|uniref:Hsp20/alpha crystallin family protein n=1 Tax=Foetidibacter luteolus TaxID=2608880 RepID=UPI00129C020C|nr:Hsp20/alpha crystallin family protein [Foetidibacter luteolus]
MATQALSRFSEGMPSVFEDFFRPWNEWFENGSLLNKTLKIPAVNITETAQAYNVSLAVPGFKKEDFNITLDGGMLTISSSKEERKEEKEEKVTRKEYNYASFSRSFSLPEEVNTDNIEAGYEDGILKISLPKKEEVKKASARLVTVK